MNIQNSETALKDTLSIVHAFNYSRELLQNKRYEEAKEFCSLVLKNDSVIGDTNDYHNFSVCYYKADDYQSAYNIVVKGLSLYPADIDLLADAICYGMNCNIACEEYYKKISDIPFALWTWRGFCFVIDYLLEARNENDVQNFNENLEKSLQLAEVYKKVMPDDSKAYSKMIQILRMQRVSYMQSNEDARVAEKQQDIVAVLKEAARIQSEDFDSFREEYMQYLIKNNYYNELIEYCKHRLLSLDSSSNEKWGEILMTKALAEAVMSIEKLLSGTNEPNTIQSVYNDFVIAMSCSPDAEKIHMAVSRCKLIAQYSNEEIPEKLLQLFGQAYS